MAYIVQFLLTAVLCTVNDSTKNRTGAFFSFAACVILFFMSALRVNIGTDYGNYVALYNNLTSPNYLYDFGIEPGFYFVAKLSRFFFDSHAAMFAIMAAITVIPAFLLSTKSSSTLILIVFLSSFYLTSYSIVRQMGAVSILLLSSYHLLNGNIKKSYVYVLIACLLHYSAILFVPFILARRLRIGPALGVGIIAVFIVFINVFNLPGLILSSELLSSTKYASYAGTMFVDKTKLGSGLGVALKLLPSIMTIFLIYFLRIDNNKNRGESRIILLLNYAFIMASMLVLSVHIFNRVSDVLNFVPVISACFLYKESGKNKYIILAAYVVIFSVRYFLIVNGSPSSIHSGLGINPYEWSI